MTSRRRALLTVAATGAAATAIAWAVLSIAWPRHPVHLHVRWKAPIADADREALERRFRLTAASRIDGESWQYLLTDPSAATIRAIVQHERVDDTEHLNRIRFRPEFAQDRSRQILASSIAAGGAAALAFWLVPVAVRRAALVGTLAAAREWLPSPRPAVADVSPTFPRLGPWRTAAPAAFGGVLLAIAMGAFAGASVWSAAAALLVVSGGGSLVGLLLVGRSMRGTAWAIVRIVAGLFLATVAFLLSLVLRLPWVVLPVLLVAAGALRWWLGRHQPLAAPAAHRPAWDRVAAVALVAILLSPIAISHALMAPGTYPPVFINIDTAYHLEKVHTLTAGDAFPPASLSNLGAERTYHYGTHGAAALIARTSGLRPHHALFLVLLPLLVLGVAAAAFAAASVLCPAVPRVFAVALLLVSVPALARPFWDRFGGQLWTAATSDPSIATLLGDEALWGVLSNEGQNVGGDFITLASIAGIAGAGGAGWALPVFLLSVAFLFKSTAGVALLGAFGLAETWRAVMTRPMRPPMALLLTGSLFVLMTAAFFWVSFASEYRVELFPLAHLRDVGRPAGLVTLLLDVGWLLLPGLIVLPGAAPEAARRAGYFLVMGMAPILIVNGTRLDNVTSGGGGTGQDWIQILHAVPFLMHAAALSLVSARWPALSRARRAAVLAAIAVAVLPVAGAAGRYSARLAREPRSGNDFVDNAPLGRALAAVPTTGTVIVTNDLRYPADGFSRPDRQMQIPALFGHQAFAVNYVYELVPEEAERRALQRLLQQHAWSSAVLAAARTHGWTHLLIRKDAPHPTPIPLARVFDGADYAVYRFPGAESRRRPAGLQ